MTATLETRETDGFTSRRWFRVLKSVLAWGLLLVVAFFIWPSSLGGGTTAIVVNGHSMEPTYYTGDIVVAREGDPQIGDIVVYSTVDLGGGKIVHRIIGGDGESGWDLQGDNNDFVDPFHPTNDEILGIAKFHIPKLGLVVGILGSPLVWGSMLLIAFGLVIWPSKECPELPERESEAGAQDSDFSDDEADAAADFTLPPAPEQGQVRE
ncbi:signal peptidase I [Demequina aurantiaca]|uniref:signal peptidase I n=1 Tax=Demequina aurantiaca TaxID=676200 RepID=UPI000784603B|nr:signal peptidase I [Demequina aurantiaca]